MTSGGQAGRRALGVALALTGGVATLMNGNGPATSAPLAEAKGAYVSFENAPFPYRGIIPRKDIPFIDTVENGRHGHTSPRAGKVYWEDETYSDRRSLIYVPKGFDIDHPAVIVVFFHGNQATLSRDVVDRQRVPHQVAKSGLNAVLLAPQFAVDALDSSSGNFWTPGIFARYLDEAAGRIASVYGDESKASAFAKLPVVIVAYSGGYNPAAFAVGVGGAADRILGLVLLDAVYAEEDQFAGWIAANKESAFLFSAFTESAAANNAVLRQLLTERGTRFSRRLPSKLTPGTVAFFATDPDLVHDDFVTHAWVDDPVAWTLSRVPGYRR
ncbi:MAG: hypothetical protein KDJ86_08620 [Bauldia sp.]|uniref:hypothetical protein n=1 Tax=Bauldia sp. TaxID=2575872 RepID=UPI001DCE9315|nr:hypothetical protein [Bauldia sp.]MCB1495832.1 hypothetical protein [Bauldia sp.]